MAVFIHDTARNNLSTWTANAIGGGYAVGAMLSPFTSPRESNGYKKAATDVASSIQDAGGELWFDSMTYALGMPRAGDFRHYDGWSLWTGDRGDLVSVAEQRTHAQAVFSLQVDLNSPPLAPTVLVSYPDTPTSQTAMQITTEALMIEPNAWATVAGDQQFWAAGAELDAHVGALDQLEPRGWLLAVARSDNSMPTGASAEETFGLMRATFALSQDRSVRVAFGDLAALPAVAAGAEAVGTGWDMRQRICAYQDFEVRAADPGGGGWYQRPTLEGLLGSLTAKEYQVLTSEQAALALRLTPGTVGPQPEQAFRHHAQVLNSVIDELAPLRGRARVEAFRRRLTKAAVEWPKVQRITGTRVGYDQWAGQLDAGIQRFCESEGWA
ncbi:MAG: hypothetical protein ACRCYR_01925 [Phycicoccus sp.]